MDKTSYYCERKIAELIEKGNMRGGQYRAIDLYNMSKTSETAFTIRTNVATCGHFWVLDYGV